MSPNPAGAYSAFHFVMYQCFHRQSAALPLRNRRKGWSTVERSKSPLPSLGDKLHSHRPRKPTCPAGHMAPLHVPPPPIIQHGFAPAFISVCLAAHSCDPRKSSSPPNACFTKLITSSAAITCKYGVIPSIIMNRIAVAVDMFFFSFKSDFTRCSRFNEQFHLHSRALKLFIRQIVPSTATRTIRHLPLRRNQLLASRGPASIARQSLRSSSSIGVRLIISATQSVTQILNRSGLLVLSCQLQQFFAMRAQCLERFFPSANLNLDHSTLVSRKRSHRLK